MTDYEIYVEKYATIYKITKAEAETHAIVKEIKEYYEESNNARAI